MFKVEERVHDFFYVVEQGALSQMASFASQLRKIDECDAGDVVGLRPFFASNAYKMLAHATEDSIVYAIQIGAFKPLLQQHQEVLQFLSESFASNTRNPTNKEEFGQLISENLTSTNNLEVTKCSLFSVTAIYT